MPKVDLTEPVDPHDSMPGTQSQNSPRVASGPARRRWRLRGILLLMTAFLLLPTALSIFGQMPILLQKLHPPLASAIQFRTISLHWWAPVEIAGLTVRDLSQTGDSKPLLQIQVVKSAEPLWKIALSLGRRTTLLLDQPELELVMDEQGNNLQRTLEAIFGTSNRSSGFTFPIRVTIVNGRISVLSAIQSDAAVLAELNGTVSTPTAAGSLPEIRLVAQFHDDREMTQSQAKAMGTTNSGAPRPGRSRLAANLDELVSDFAVVPLTTFSSPRPTESAEGLPPQHHETTRLLIHTGPAAQSADRSQTGARQTIRISARRLDLRLLQPVQNLLEMSGSTGAPGSDQLQCEGTADCDLEIELAGPAISDGLVGRMLFEGQQLRIRLSDWSADEWLQFGDTFASGAIAVAHDGILLNQVSVRSDLLEATGSGEYRATPVSATDAPAVDSSELAHAADRSAMVQGKLNLARMLAMLPRTLGVREDVEVRSGNLTFLAKAELASTTRPTAINVDTDLHTGGVGRWQVSIQNDRISAVRAGQPVTLDSVIRLDAVGRLRAEGPDLTQARFLADFGTMELEPHGELFRLSGTMRPSVLWQQLQPFFQIPQPGISGDLRFETLIWSSPRTTRLTQLLLSGTDIRAGSDMLKIHHGQPLPAMIEGSLLVDGSGAAIRTLVLPWHDASWLAAHSRVKLQLAAIPRQPVQLKALVQPEKIASGSPSRFQIDDAIIELSLKTADRVGIHEIENGRVQLPGLHSAVTGTVTTTGSRVELDLTADTGYDLQVLCDRLLPADSLIRLNGQGRETFRVTGSVLTEATATDRHASAVPDLRATGSFAWSSGVVCGLQLGPGSVTATLENGQLRTSPLHCQLHTGDIHLMPQLDLGRQQLHLATGSRVRNLSLTPELCRNWLAYLSPLMSDVATVGGQLSARVERFRYDLNAPQNSDAAFVVTIHSAEAGPGPALLPLLEALDVARRIASSDRNTGARSVVLPPQDVPVQLQQGHVTHRGLIIDLAGYRAQSSGSVGLNGQLQLTLEVPLERSANNADVRQVRIPIRGTIERPLPDTAALLQSLGTQEIQRNLNNQLDRQLNRLLDKL